MAEGTSLLRTRTLTGTVGSNPTLSVSLAVFLNTAFSYIAKYRKLKDTAVPVFSKVFYVEGIA